MQIRLNDSSANRNELDKSVMREEERSEKKSFLVKLKISIKLAHVPDVCCCWHELSSRRLLLFTEDSETANNVDGNI